MKRFLSCLFIILLEHFRGYSQCNTALIISQGHPAFASSQESASYPPGNAFDGDRTTRWSSAFSDPQYLYVDLGAVTDLCQVNLIWESAYGEDFTIDVSDDTISWSTVATITGNASLTNSIPIAASGRYVRMNGTKRGTPNGYSLFGLHVYGTAPSPFCSATNLALGGAATASSTESIAFPASSAFDGDLNTRWSSAFSDPQSIYVDLGGTYSLCDVTLSWEAAYATDFTLDVSQDASSWSTIASFTGNTSTTDTIPVSGLARYVRMSGTNRATSYGYSLLEFTVHGYIVLPITLGEFKASVKDDKYVSLHWTTEQEIDNDHFDIGRRTEGVPFTNIGAVKGGGNVSVPTHYTWTDSFPARGFNAYRLRQVDKNGKHTYYGVASVTLGGLARTAVRAYPNPVTDYLTVKVQRGEHILSAGLYNASGIKLLEYKGASNNTVVFPMKSMPPGAYIIRVHTQNHSQSIKVLKDSF